MKLLPNKVIENAENNNLDAQFAVLAAATNILSETEQDDVKAKTIEDERLYRHFKSCHYDVICPD